MQRNSLWIYFHSLTILVLQCTVKQICIFPLLQTKKLCLLIVKCAQDSEVNRNYDNTFLLLGPQILFQWKHICKLKCSSCQMKLLLWFRNLNSQLIYNCAKFHWLTMYFFTTIVLQWRIQENRKKSSTSQTHELPLNK